MKVLQVEALALLPLVIILLINGPQETDFSQDSCCEKEKAKAWCQPEKTLVFQEEIPHSSDIFSDHLTRKDWHRVNDQWWGRAYPAWVCLLVHTSCLPPTHKPNVWTLKMNLGGHRDLLIRISYQCGQIEHICLLCFSVLLCLFSCPVEDKLKPG